MTPLACLLAKRHVRVFHHVVVAQVRIDYAPFASTAVEAQP
ncbi:MULTISPECIES: hypothetical protein [Xanthomonas]|nr:MULTISPECIES: hypothetical protein [Xanthomonas]